VKEIQKEREREREKEKARENCCYCKNAFILFYEYKITVLDNVLNLMDKFRKRN